MSKKQGNLLLTRRPDEGITITVPPSDGNTVVHLYAKRITTESNQVRFAISAPKEVLIVRDELMYRDAVRNKQEQGAA